MHNDASGREQDRWRSLVHEVHRHLDQLVADFCAQVRSIAPYDTDVVPEDVVRRDAECAFDYLLLGLSDVPQPSSTTLSVRALGRDRARRRVPLDSFRAAMRLDFAVLWAALRKLAGPDDAQVLVAHAQELLTQVEGYVALAQAAYLDEEAVMAREAEYAVADLVTRLLDEPVTDVLIDRVTRALDVPPTARFVLAAAPAGTSAPLLQAYRRLAAEGRTVSWIEREAHALLLLRWHADELGSSVHEMVGGATCAIAPVTLGLRELPGGARLAGRLAEVLVPDGGVLGVRDLWLRVAVRELPDLATALSLDALGPLDRLASAERDRLLQTARGYLDSGSVATCAAELCCHRNTVLNRLRRVEQLTGLDLARPADAALLGVALAARELHDESLCRQPGA